MIEPGDIVEPVKTGGRGHVIDVDPRSGVCLVYMYAGRIQGEVIAYEENLRVVSRRRELDAPEERREA